MNPQWQIGDKIENRWEMHKVLKGGMGIVYVVYDHDWKEVLAAKTFQSEVFAQNAAIAGLFKREARTWIDLDVHENVTQAVWVQNVYGQPFLFLEYVSGGDLSNWIGTPRLTEDLPQVLRFAIQFCDGMIHALSKGIKAHRDIKPQNCLITKDNVLKVTDFGLAKIFDETSFESRSESASRYDVSNMLVSRTGSAAGTPPYMAPEQFDDAKHVGVRADIYSFGIMLFEMLEGRRPFSARTLSDMERLHKNESPPRLTTNCWPVAVLVERCLAKHPEQRFENFEVVRKTLAQIFEKLTGEPARAPAVGRKLEAEDYNNKGGSLSALGHHEEGIAYFDRAIELRADDATLHQNKGKSLDALSRREEAIACFNRAIELRPDDAGTHKNKGISLGALGHYEEAIACYDRAIELRPDDADIHYNKGVNLGALGHYEEAIACYDRAIELRPHHAYAHINKGGSLSIVGRHEEAIGCFDRAIELQPDDAGPHLGKGGSLSFGGHHEEAIRCFDRAIALRPDDAPTHFLRGLSLGVLGHHEEAIACFDRAIELKPLDSNAHFGRGCALEALGRLQEAVIAYQGARNLGQVKAAKRIEAIREKLLSGNALQERRGVVRKTLAQIFEQLTGESPRAPAIGRKLEAGEHYNKGKSLGALGHHDEAIACYDRAIELQPDDAETHFVKGISLGALGQHEEAVACYDRAMELRPDDARTHAVKGLSLSVLGHHEEAIACYDRAIELQPNDANAYNNKGASLLMLGHYEEAIACYDRAIALKPLDKNANFGRGCALERLDRLQEAVMAYQDAHNLGHVGAAKNIEAIRENLLSGSGNS